MCKFCEAMESNRKVDRIMKKHDPEVSYRYSVAIVKRIFLKNSKGCRGSSTDYRYQGCGYELNFCPECGQALNRKDAQKMTQEKEHRLQVIRSICGSYAKGACDGKCVECSAIDSPTETP